MELNNIDMEASVLGSILAHNEVLYKVLDILRPECFVEGLHRDIYICIKELLDKGEQVSPFRVYNNFAERLGENNKQYIASLPSLARVISIRSDIKHLSDLADRRALSSLCNVMLNQLSDFNKTGMEKASELVSQTTKLITGVNSNTSVDIAEGMFNILQQMKSEKPVYQARTGINILDAAMDGGMQKGRVYAFMAAPKCGKTMLATMISNHLNDNGHKHVFVCAEMGSNEIIQRMAGQRMGVATNEFLQRNPDTIKKFERVIETIKRNAIFEDVPGVEFEHLKALIELHVYKNKIEGFILDYYQLVSGCEKNGTQAQHLENVANWIHRVCKRHNIWCVLLVQTNDQQQVLGSRGLNRACDQGYLLERPLDEQGDPSNSNAWLKLRFSRYTRTYSLGSELTPCLRVHRNGTHFEELDQYGSVAETRYFN